MKELQVVLISMLIAVIPVLSTFIVAYIKSKTDQVKSKTKNSNASYYIDIAEKAINTAIGSVAQTYVIALKSTGNFDDAAQSRALYEATEIVLNITSDAVKDVLVEAHGDLEAWITNSIQDKIKELKEKKAESDNLIQALNGSVELVKPTI